MSSILSPTSADQLIQTKSNSFFSKKSKIIQEISIQAKVRQN